MSDLSAGPVQHPPILIAGPTAVGKTECALALARELQGEIISVDSMQVYRGMDIGTAKPTLAEQQSIPHHLLDILDITQAFDVVQFVKLAGHAITDVQRRGRVPILCGGTGLYFKALIQGVAGAPAGEPALRSELKDLPLPELIRQLAALDPDALSVVDLQNPRRVLRALELVKLTGKPLAHSRAVWNRSETSGSTFSRLFGLRREREDLCARINLRVDVMFAAGLVAETARLLTAGLEKNPVALQAIGYAQVVDHLRGVRGLPETIDIVQARTRQFAKRQMTWFRRQLAMNWVDLAPSDSGTDAARRILAALKSSSPTVSHLEKQ